jgi:hypothetical protein
MDSGEKESSARSIGDAPTELRELFQRCARRQEGFEQSDQKKLRENLRRELIFAESCSLQIFQLCTLVLIRVFSETERIAVGS